MEGLPRRGGVGYELEDGEGAWYVTDLSLLIE